MSRLPPLLRLLTALASRAACGLSVVPTIPAVPAVFAALPVPAVLVGLVPAFLAAFLLLAAAAFLVPVSASAPVLLLSRLGELTEAVGAVAKSAAQRGDTAVGQGHGSRAGGRHQLFLHLAAQFLELGRLGELLQATAEQFLRGDAETAPGHQ
ncbi:hypothetical protein ACWV95_35325 [Streptomyces albus]